MLSQCLLGSVFHMFIQYQYLSINKNENELRQMSLKYASIHQITQNFRNVHREQDPETSWQAYVWLYVQWYYFLSKDLHVLKIMKTKLILLF